MESFDDIFNQPTKQDTHSFSSFNKEEWVAQKKQDRESAYAMMETTALEIAANGAMLQSYLDVQARFDRYSVGNALLIAVQCPEATRLADFDTWKKEGAYVKKGETGILIMEPGKEYQRENGTVGVSYNAKRLFDISQTNAKQQPTLTVYRDERLLIKALINHAPCELSITADLPDNSKNVIYSPEKKTIFLRQGLDGPTIFRGLSQELARAYMDKGKHICASPGFAAYCVSYMLCKRNGIAVDGYRFHKLPEAYSTMDAKAIRSELSIMRGVAGDITTNMNRVFGEKNRSQKSREDGAR